MPRDSSSHPARAGASDVLVRAADLDGGNRRDIPTGGGIHRGYLQVAGDHIYFTVLENGRPIPFRVPLGGGARARGLRRSEAAPRAVRDSTRVCR